MRQRILRAVDWCMFRLSREQVIAGFRVRYVRPRGANASLVIARIRDALALIERVDTLTFARLKRDLGGIWVYWSYSQAHHIGSWGICVLDEDAVSASDTSAATVASWIVHEGMHARLWHAGFRYDATNRERIERICVRAELNFALRNPDGEAQVAEATAMLERSSNVWSAAARDDALIRRLEALQAPRWLLRWAGKRARSNA